MYNVHMKYFILATKINGNAMLRKQFLVTLLFLPPTRINSLLQHVSSVKPFVLLFIFVIYT